MAKISLNKITPIKKIDNVIITIGEQNIEIIQYLSVGEKLEMLEQILNSVVDNTGYFNPIKMEIYFLLYLIKYYTNISLTDKMMNEPVKTYDLLEVNNIFNKVIEAIPEEEYSMLYEAVNESAMHIIKYLDSFVGMMRSVAADYDATKLNVEEIMSALDQPDKVGLVKDILDKIG